MTNFSTPQVLTVSCFLAWFLVSYLYHGIGITLGYHRLLTHASLKMPKWLMYFICFGGYFALMGSPVVWVAVHRLHHQKSDLEGDPHSPKDGFIHSLVGWMFNVHQYQSDEEIRRQARELINDPVFKWLGVTHAAYQAQLCLASCILFRVVLWFVGGPIAVLANLTATFFVFWSTQFVNAICHLPGAGYKTFDSGDDSLNVWWVGILALGEGWHNNHHGIPKSARHGMRWWEVDVTWYTIWVLEKLGLASNVVRPDNLLERRLKTVWKRPVKAKVAVMETSLSSK